MKFVADLHLHSSYARATSKNLNFPNLTKWARMKGIDLLSSADFTHPLWFEETKKTLKDSGDGFFEYDGFKFVLGAEVSCIYSQGGKLRRIHCLIYTPDIESAQKINKELLSRGAKLASDGRPIIGLSARNLLEIILEANPKSIMIPAHAWTPWFGLYGANSGFDSIEEAFGDLERYIYGIETGLSSNPEMNWLVEELDDRSIVSFSDAHSPAKMGREVTIFENSLTYDGLLDSLKNQKIVSSIEFFPEEGKYHFTGHRACFIRHSPDETAKLGIACPVCKKTLTLGVMYRVSQLASKNRPEGFRPVGKADFKMMVPLLEIIAEAIGSPVTSKKVEQIYQNLLNEFGNELNILLNVSEEELKRIGTERVGIGVAKVRAGNIVIEPGYDGVYGVVKIWPETKVKERVDQKKPLKKVEDQTQISLFETV